jgi:hypothetical protein
MRWEKRRWMRRHWITIGEVYWVYVQRALRRHITPCIYASRINRVSLNFEADHKPFIKEVVKVCTKRLQTLEMCKERQWV